MRDLEENAAIVSACASTTSARAISVNISICSRL